MRLARRPHWLAGALVWLALVAGLVRAAPGTEAPESGASQQVDKLGPQVSVRAADYVISDSEYERTVEKLKRAASYEMGYVADEVSPEEIQRMFRELELTTSGRQPERP